MHDTARLAFITAGHIVMHYLLGFSDVAPLTSRLTDARVSVVVHLSLRGSALVVVHLLPRATALESEERGRISICH
jgi:hypothetical protein